MNLDRMVDEAKERINRSIGQRARFAKAALAAQAARLRDPRARAVQRLKNRFLRDLMDNMAADSLVGFRSVTLHRGADDEEGSVIRIRRPEYTSESVGD